MLLVATSLSFLSKCYYPTFSLNPGLSLSLSLSVIQTQVKIPLSSYVYCFTPSIIAFVFLPSKCPLSITPLFSYKFNFHGVPED
ncbi:hypothetical protein L6452_00668 [Arctium lappa]|uniref:Uncharacterized protein n=1 Tax=Arctium lappa TaxID=4217 RepID=A0ACB9FE53_ARCLA|nr:hypothetical protein L6452_00668 [Arctium lappa]